MIFHDPGAPCGKMFCHPVRRIFQENHLYFPKSTSQAVHSMNILVTGAFGNHGTHTIRELIQQGYKTRCLDLQTPRNQKSAAQLQGLVEIAAPLGWRKLFIPLTRPFARASMLKFSPYLKK